MIINPISDPIQKLTIARVVLEALPEWFGIEDAREKYITESAGLVFLGAFDLDRPIGFLTLKETGKDTVELHVMGVLKDFQRQGAGKALMDEAKRVAIDRGYSFLQVKTVQMGKYPEYDQTNRFYLAQGFKELEVFPNLWDAWNPCQIYVMALGEHHV
jgi:GNAT superfamily N-acetyltransferase